MVGTNLCAFEISRKEEEKKNRTEAINFKKEPGILHIFIFFVTKY